MLDMNFMAVNGMEGDAVFITTYSGEAVGKLIVQDETIKEPYLESYMYRMMETKYNSFNL